MLPSAEHASPSAFTGDAGSTVSGAHISSSDVKTQSNGMGLERQRFLNRGCSAKAVNTLMMSHKKSAYNRVWQKFLDIFFRLFLPAMPQKCHIMNFLHKDVDMGLMQVCSKTKYQQYQPSQVFTKQIIVW